ncbi:MAG: ABC transporter ATP-binding protein [Bacteroidetes bacterium]|nr:ABC transporter ATP-binding protein [Bacteroidota bacterium]
MSLIKISEFNAIAEDIHLVKDVSFDVDEGKITGIVGESGSGKSVTCMGITKLLPKTVKINGNVLFTKNDGKTIDLLHCNENELTKLRGKEISYVFQEPMTALNPVYTCGFQVCEAILAHQKINKNELKSKVLNLFGEVKLPDTERIFNSYPHQISGGQRQRVMIAMALANNPRLLIADEPTTALDASVQKSIIDLMVEMVKKRGMSMIFISHDLNCLKSVANHIIVMYKGQIVETGDKNKIFENPSHPYTKALMKTRPDYKNAGYILPTISDLIGQNENGEFFEKKFEVIKRNKNLIGNKILDVNNITKSYFKNSFFAKNKNSQAVIKGISFSAYSNSTIGIVGESGCGKSTLAKILTNLEKETSGDFKNLSTDKSKIQMVFQDPYSSLNPTITAGEAISEPMIVNKINSKKNTKQETLKLLELTGLTADFYYKYPHQMSGGQRQRVCIARALSTKPSILILDEAVSALDVSVQSQILNLLKDLQSKLSLTYLFISHDLNIVGYMADEIIILKNGKIEEQGKLPEILNNPQTEYTKFLINCIYN